MDRVSFVIGSRADADSDSEEVDSHDDDSTTVTPASLSSALADSAGDGQCPLTKADLSWGFKESFRSYISGTIANGDWEVADGASYDTPNFHWTSATGNATSSDKARISFTGTVRFNGHNGALSTTIADPTLVIAGEKATLGLDVSGASRDAAMTGQNDTQEFPDIAFASVDLSTLKRDGNTWSVTSAPTSLTSSGHQAFDSYEAGTALDPVTFSVTFGDCVNEEGQDGGPTAAAREAISAALDRFDVEPWMGVVLAVVGGAGLAIGGDRAVRKLRSHR
jgi:hypothetical protein